MRAKTRAVVRRPFGEDLVVDPHILSEGLQTDGPVSFSATT
ncbi:hypothetical protein C6341_g10691 [Phytophthora cactorum]|nr:hypothetical protein C6341_g10691 [Phytophthora cactorum]